MIVTVSFLCEDLTTLTPYHDTLTSSVMIFFMHPCAGYFGYLC